MNGLYVLDGADIISGKKTAIAAPDARDIAGDRVLVVKTDEGGLVVGVVAIGAPRPVDVKTFDSKTDQHNVSPTDRMRWWPGVRTLFIYPIEGYTLLTTPLALTIPPGVGMKMDITLSTATILSRTKEGSKFIHVALIE